jgi:hypothetical protein
MPGCRVGDRAVIINTGTCDDGRFVDVKQRHYVAEALWQCGPVFVVYAADRRPLANIEGPAVRSVIADRFLQPIRGQRAPESTPTAADLPQPVEV